MSRRLLRDEVLLELTAGRACVMKLAARLRVPEKYVYVIVADLMRAGHIRRLPVRLYDTTFATRPMTHYELASAPPSDIGGERNGNPVRRLKSETAPHVRTRSGSGQITGPCISRQFKWGAGV